MIKETLVNGELLNENDEIVGSYYKVDKANRYNVTINGNSYFLTETEFKSKITELNLYTNQIR